MIAGFSIVFRHGNWIRVLMVYAARFIVFIIVFYYAASCIGSGHKAVEGNMEVEKINLVIFFKMGGGGRCSKLL